MSLCLSDSPLSPTLCLLSVRGVSAFTMEPARLCNRDRLLAQLAVLSSQVSESSEIGANAAAASPDEQSSNYAKSNHYSGSCFTPCGRSDRADWIYLLDFRYNPNLSSAVTTESERHRDSRAAQRGRHSDREADTETERET